MRPLCALAKPNIYGLGPAEDGFHEWYLVRLLYVVGLINADGVDPDA